MADATTRPKRRSKGVSQPLIHGCAGCLSAREQAAPWEPGNRLRASRTPIPLLLASSNKTFASSSKSVGWDADEQREEMRTRRLSTQPTSTRRLSTRLSSKSHDSGGQAAPLYTQSHGKSRAMGKAPTCQHQRNTMALPVAVRLPSPRKEERTASPIKLPASPRPCGEESRDTLRNRKERCTTQRALWKLPFLCPSKANPSEAPSALHSRIQFALIRERQKDALSAQPGFPVCKVQQRPNSHVLRENEFPPQGMSPAPLNTVAARKFLSRSFLNTCAESQVGEGTSVQAGCSIGSSAVCMRDQASPSKKWAALSSQAATISRCKTAVRLQPSAALQRTRDIDKYNQTAHDIAQNLLSKGVSRQNIGRLISSPSFESRVRSY